MKIIVQFVILLLTLNGYVLAAEVSTATNSLEQVQKQAEAGDAGAQTRLGWIYANGIGVPVDADQAVEWYQKAAAQGYPKAQFELGAMYGSGEAVTSVAKDPIKAAEWYKKAAAQGYPKAQFELGAIHLTGEGVTERCCQSRGMVSKSGSAGSCRSADQPRMDVSIWQGRGKGRGVG
ncbi:MAG: sel1 repeat family protein [Nitrosomonadales bacterium]|nr:sel1 repeat family protein [Nitrosomonadales bacterium]